MKSLIGLWLLLFGWQVSAADVDSALLESQRRGFVVFAQYCAGCHSTHYQRYSQVAKDLQFSEAELRHYVGDEVRMSELMENAMSKKEADNWFGMAPPDLTLVARVRGLPWLREFLLGFYRDDQRPFGVNNLRYPYTSMPHVLQPLQGLAEPIYGSDMINGKPKQVVVGVTDARDGTLSTAQYQAMVEDISEYLAYTAEPVKSQRERLGVWVMAFLALFFVLAWLLKKEYWKDVH